MTKPIPAAVPSQGCRPGSPPRSGQLVATYTFKHAARGVPMDIATARAGCVMREFRKLLEEALRIKMDILRRLSRQPENGALPREWWWYHDLAHQLVTEYEIALDRYLAHIQKQLNEG